MAKIPPTVDVTINAELSRALDQIVRFIIRDELRRLATELSVRAMNERSDAVTEDDELVARVLDLIADVTQESAYQSEMEAR